MNQKLFILKIEPDLDPKSEKVCENWACSSTHIYSVHFVKLKIKYIRH